MSPVRVDDQASLDPRRLAGLEASQAGLTTLGRVLDWTRTCSPPTTISEVVTQDEYTHDVIVPFEDGLFLVYDTT